MPDLPRGYHPKAHGGVTHITYCRDCVLAMEKQWLCPAIELMKEEGIRPFRAMYRPQESQNTIPYAESLFTSMQDRAERFGCIGKRLFVLAEREYRDMLAKERK